LTGDSKMAAPTVEDWNRFEEWLERIGRLPIPPAHDPLRSFIQRSTSPRTIVASIPLDIGTSNKQFLAEHDEQADRD